MTNISKVSEFKTLLLLNEDKHRAAGMLIGMARKTLNMRPPDLNGGHMAIFLGPPIYNTHYDTRPQLTDRQRRWLTTHSSRDMLKALQMGVMWSSMSGKFKHNDRLAEDYIEWL